MRTIKIWNDDATEKQIDDVADILKGGGVAILPTDSLYAIVCDCMNVKAIDRLCRAKGINPDKNTLTVICNDISMAAEYAQIDNEGFALLKENTPGPISFIFKAKRNLPKAFKDRKEVAIRIPEKSTVRAIASALGNPLFSTSIEFEDDDYGRNPELIAERYDNLADLMIDDGDGLTEHTTVVDCKDGAAEIIREGLGELQ